MIVKDAALLNMARNALLVAGHEMGRDGDHWPVIKSAVHGLARAYEALKIEEEVANQIKTHMRKALDEYEALVDSYGDVLDEPQMQELQKFIKDMRDLYTARFDEPMQDNMKGSMDDWMKMASGMEGMMPWKRAAAIINTLDEGAE